MTLESWWPEAYDPFDRLRQHVAECAECKLAYDDAGFCEDGETLLKAFREGRLI